MKKTVFLVLTVVVLFASCSSTFKMVYDTSLPAEQNAVVTFVSSTRSGYFVLSEYNGQDIKEILYGKKLVWSNDTSTLTIPSGKTTFDFNLRYTFSNNYSSTTYDLGDLSFTYNFEPGKKYRINGTYKGLFKLEFFVELYDVTKKKTLLERMKVGGT